MAGKNFSHMFFVYVLRCSDKSYYVGHIDDVESRIALHNCGQGGKYTSERSPVTVVYVEEFETRDEAFNAEMQIKGWSRLKKEALINKNWGELKKLASRAKKSNPSRRGFAAPQDER